MTHTPTASLMNWGALFRSECNSPPLGFFTSKFEILICNQQDKRCKVPRAEALPPCSFLYFLFPVPGQGLGVTSSHLSDGHPVPVVDMRGCGTLGKRVITGVGEVMTVGASPIAVGKGFCKKRRK